jgi:hypothetical protein
MASRVTFSRLHIGLPEIVEHHDDLGASLKLYFNAASPTFTVRFAGYSNTEVVKELGDRLDETELTSSLAVLASLEAAFRIAMATLSTRHSAPGSARISSRSATNRTAPGRFFLREFLTDVMIPEEHRQPVATRRRFRELMRGPAWFHRRVQCRVIFSLEAQATAQLLCASASPEN